MGGQWKEVVRLAFKGQRFRDHALDLSAITELSQFQKLVAETAKALWRAAHPGRVRLPKHFEQRTRLCLRKIEEGSAVTPLEVYIDEPVQKELFEPEPTEVNEAIGVAHGILRSAEKDEPLPENVPKDLVPEYQRWGQGLEESDVIEVVAAGKGPVRVTPLSRSRLAAFCEAAHQDHVDLTGEVLEADVRQGRFQLWLDDKTGVTVTFTPAQEREVMTALRDHRSLRIQVVGKAEFSPQGKPLRVAEVDQLRLQPVGEVPHDPAARPIVDVLEELASQIPQEEWDKLPADLSDNLDHYLYGTPKR